MTFLLHPDTVCKTLEFKEEALCTTVLLHVHHNIFLIFRHTVYNITTVNAHINNGQSFK